MIFKCNYKKEKEIDRLLRILDEDSNGFKTNQILDDYNIDKNIIRKAKNMGYIRFYNEDKSEYTEIIDNKYFCRITPDGSQALNRYGGFENILKYDRASRIMAISAIVISLSSLIVTIIIAFLK